MALLAQGGPAWALCDLLRGVRDRTKDARLGAVAAGKLLARKRPALIPIEDSAIAEVFGREAPDRDEGWWDDVRTAMQDDEPKANGRTFVGLPHGPSRGSLPGSSSGVAGSRHYRLNAYTLGCLTALRDIPALRSDMPTSSEPAQVTMCACAPSCSLSKVTGPVSRLANHGQGGHSAASWGVRVHERYMEGGPEVDGRWTDAAKPVVCPNVRTGLGDCVGPRLGGPRAQVFFLEGAGGASTCGFGFSPGSCKGLYVAVRGIGPAGAPAYVHSGRRAWDEHPSASFAQVRGYMEVQAGAVCKTVGSAYVGSNPTPATTCENGPLAVDSPLAGRFFSVPSCVTL